MKEDIDSDARGVVANATPRVATPVSHRPARTGGITWLIAFLALIIAAFALWRVSSIEHSQSDTVGDLRSELANRIDALERTAAQRKQDIDSLTARAADSDRVDRTERENLLSLNDRSRHMEEALAHLAQERLSGRDAMARSDAEFLLQQAEQRLQLFHDTQAAIAAYQLADSTLAATGDPVFGSVREMIKGEFEAIQASNPLQTPATIAAIERVRTDLPNLSTPQAATTAAAPESRWQRFIDQFVRVSHERENVPIVYGIRLSRELIALDLRDAEAALLARDAKGYAEALKRAQAGIQSGFDTSSPPAQRAVAELQRLAKQSLAPTIPDLGGALKALRNLQVTQTLATPPATSPENAPAHITNPSAPHPPTPGHDP